MRGVTLILVMAVGGCHLLLPGQADDASVDTGADQPTVDRGPPGDQAIDADLGADLSADLLGDGGLDGTSIDGGLDQLLDAPGDGPVDAGPDANADVNAGLDVIADVAADAPTADGPMFDGVVSDLMVDQLSQPDGQGMIGCAMGPSVLNYMSGSMLLCQAPNLTQCAAHTACAGPYHLCTATEYRTRGGAGIPAPQQGWIASCVRELGGAMPPTEAICGGCETASGPEVTIRYPGCSTMPGDTTSLGRIGVKSFGLQYRVGQPGPQYCGFWNPHPASQPLDYALCCSN